MQSMLQILDRRFELTAKGLAFDGVTTGDPMNSSTSRSRSSVSSKHQRRCAHPSRTCSDNDCSQADIGVKSSPMVTYIVNEVRAINHPSCIVLRESPRTIEWE